MRGSVADSEGSLELCARLLDHCHRSDRLYLDIAEKLKTRSQNGVMEALSGLAEADYASLEGLGLGSGASEALLSQPRPLPQELLDQFSHMQCNCAMGLVSSIGRAWVSIDSDLYVWNYHTGRDLAYYDGLGTTILTVGLAMPRAGVFQSTVGRLLVVATPVEVALLAVTFTGESGQLLENPSRASAEADGAVVTDIAATSNGRIFYSARDGCLYELHYRDRAWLQGAKAWKTNHSKGFMSMLVPSFVNYAFGRDEALVQLVLDQSRHILYSLSETGGLQVFDLGSDGSETNLVSGWSGGQIRSAATGMAATMEPSHLGPIVRLSALESPDSQELSLIGITGAGVRLYFSVFPARVGASPDGPEQQRATRPLTLRLVHIRLPPGFTPSVPVQRPQAVHLALLTKEHCLFLSAEREDNDTLWLQSMANFPFKPGFSETHTQVNLRGRSWCIVEDQESVMSEDSALEAWIKRNPGLTPPLVPAWVVRQHREGPKVVHILSAQGIQRLELLRPLDLLRRLLLDHGPDSNPAKRFFTLHRAEQASAMCLALACSTAPQDAGGLTDAALRAFFLHAGDPALVPTPLQHHHTLSNHPSAPTPDTILARNRSHFHHDFSAMPGSPQFASTPQQSPRTSPQDNRFSTALAGPFANRPPAFQTINGEMNTHPLTTSILAPESHQQDATGLDSPGYGGVGPEIAFSPSHNALHLYFSRILGTLWEMRLMMPEAKAKNPRDPALLSAFGREELNWLADQVEGLETLMTKQAMVPPQATPLTGLPGSPGKGGQSQAGRVQAAAAERDSLLRLHAWLGRAREVLRLWALLNEQDLAHLISRLPPDTRAHLRSLSFRYLVTNGKGLCSDMITCLISYYLGDYATTEAISERLRTLCPGLFTSDDATAAKAAELVQSARGMEEGPGRDATIAEALALYKRVVSQLHLPTVCAQLAEVDAYSGMVELALGAAEKVDPEGLAVAFYRQMGEEGGTASALTQSGQPSPEVVQIYETRMGLYAVVLEQVERLVSGSGAATDPRLGPAEAEAQSERIIRLMVTSGDELAHVALFDWLITRGFAKKLIHLRSPFLESYLQRRVAALTNSSASSSNADVLLDLIWEFYERQSRFAEAAEFLLLLSERPSVSINLEQRLRYLSRALACAKAARVPDSVFITELEDKLEVRGLIQGVGIATGDERLVEVGHLQRAVLDSLTELLSRSGGREGGGGGGGRIRIREAITRLNASLLDVSQLYTHYAEEFGLSEAKLAIVHCAGHGDPSIIQSLWREIIDQELALSSVESTGVRGRRLGAKLGSLGRLYAGSPRFFPLDTVVEAAASAALQTGLGPAWLAEVAETLGGGGVKGLEALDSLYRRRSGAWRGEARAQAHLLQALIALLQRLLGPNKAHLGPQERTALRSAGLDAVATYLNHLRVLPDTEPNRRLLQGFQGAQMQLRSLPV